MITFKLHFIVNKKNNLINKKNITNTTNIFKCVCGKSYKHSSSLSKHKKKCKKGQVQDFKLALYNGNKKQNELFESMIEQMVNYEPPQPNQINQIINNYNHCSYNNNTTNNNTTNTTTTTTNNNDNSKNISIQTYLNTHCKDAMNLSDLVEHIIYSIDDVDKMTDEGYVKNTTNALKKSLDNMPEKDSPFHCVDKKRKKFYIKDVDGWEKDEGNKKLTLFVKKFNKKQTKEVVEWKNENAEEIEENDQMHDKSMGLIIEVCSVSKEEGDKIISKIINGLTDYNVEFTCL